MGLVKTRVIKTLGVRIYQIGHLTITDVPFLTNTGYIKDGWHTFAYLKGYLTFTAHKRLVSFPNK